MRCAGHFRHLSTLATAAAVQFGHLLCYEAYHTVYYDGDNNRRGWCMRATWHLLYKSPTCYHHILLSATTGARLCMAITVHCVYIPPVAYEGTLAPTGILLQLELSTPIKCGALWHRGYLPNPRITCGCDMFMDTGTIMRL